MVEWLEFCLRVWDRRGRKISPAEFLDRLLIALDDKVTVEVGPGVPRVRLLAVARKDFDEVDITADAGGQSEAFAAAIRDGLMQAAAWMARQPTAVFEESRADGWFSDVFVDGWVTQDQFDLEMPIEFVRACGALGLSLSLCTND